jgi:hypothetical protein
LIERSEDTKAFGASGPMSLAMLSPFALALSPTRRQTTLLDKIISTFTKKA